MKGGRKEEREARRRDRVKEGGDPLSVGLALSSSQTQDPMHPFCISLLSLSWSLQDDSFPSPSPSLLNVLFYAVSRNVLLGVRVVFAYFTSDPVPDGVPGSLTFLAK